MQFWSHCYTVVSYQALIRLSVWKIPVVCLLGAKNVFALYATLVPRLYNVDVLIQMIYDFFDYMLVW